MCSAALECSDHKMLCYSSLLQFFKYNIILLNNSWDISELILPKVKLLALLKIHTGPSTDHSYFFSEPSVAQWRFAVHADCPTLCLFTLHLQPWALCSPAAHEQQHPHVCLPVSNESSSNSTAGFISQKWINRNGPWFILDQPRCTHTFKVISFTRADNKIHEMDQIDLPT